MNEKSKMVDRVEAAKRIGAEIDQMIVQAEAHLGVAHGTLADVAQDNDYLAILKIHATIEPLLNELLQENISRVLKHPKDHFPGADALTDFVLARNLDEKRTLAVKSELLSKSQSAFIRHVANVRNRYAHNITNISLTIPEIAEKISPKDSGSEILGSLCNYRAGLPKSPPIMRVLLFWNFAALLAIVIKGIKPPELKGGILAQVGALSQDIADEPLGNETNRSQG